MEISCTVCGNCFHVPNTLYTSFAGSCMSSDHSNILDNEGKVMGFV